MRIFIISLCSLLLLTGGSLLHTVWASNTLSAHQEVLEAAFPDATAIVPSPEADARLEAELTAWEHDSMLLRYTVNEQELNAVTDALRTLQLYLRQGKAPECAQTALECKELFSRLRARQIPTLGSVFG